MKNQDISRRAFLGTVSVLATARSLLAATGASRGRVGLCSFSCHQHWKAVAAGEPGVKFKDAISFYHYARELGSEGVQTSLRSRDPAVAAQIRALVERDGGYYEGEVRLPKAPGEVAAFENEVRLVRAAGARVARAVF